jgi:diguanylate cyclase (GGDEF)-like protein
MKLVVLALALASVAHAEPRGLPVLTVIPQSQHRGGSQTFDAAQDTRGILYFGNLDGVMTYDGAWWHTVVLPNHSAVFAVESDAAGLVAAGGVGELGYLVPAADGTLAYHSLLPTLPENARDVGEVRGICTSGRGFVFAAERQTIEWNGGAPRVIASHTNGDGPARCSVIDGVTHLWGTGGLFRVERGSLVRAGLDGARIDATAGIGGRVVAMVRDGGLQVLDDQGAAPFAPEATEWLQQKQVVDAVALRDGRIAIGTREHGVLLLRADGAIDQIIDHTAGLPDDALMCTLADREGALWIAYLGSLVRVDLASPVTSFDRRRGLKGAARHLTAQRGKLWITTSQGLYALDSTEGDAVRINGIPSPAWSTLPVEDGLLVTTGDGVFIMRDETAAPVRIEGTEGLTIYEIVRSAADPARLYMAGRNALAVLQRDGSGWRYAGPVAGSPRYVRHLVQHDGVLWAGTIFDGMLRIDREGRMIRFGSGEMYAAVIGDRVVFTKPPGEIVHLRPDGTLASDPQLGFISKTADFFHVADDANGNAWINSDPPRMYAREGKGFQREPRPLTGVGTDIQMMHHVDGVMWFGSVEGLFRYAPAFDERGAAQPPPMIRRVVAGTGDTLLSEGISTLSNATALRYAFRRLRIEFAPASYRPGINYQYRLDPIDSAWSDWTSNAFIDYTHLDEGRYTFRVRTRGATGVISSDAQWSFTVHPPWYRTPWAMLLALLAAAALVALIVKLRTRALRRQAARLQALVESRTRELAKTVDLLEQANDHLERLSLLDELTGIPNRRYFDRALAETLDAAAQTMQPLSLILLDLDHFKALNDARGHPAGDASLVQVARLLARKIRRSGEMVLHGGDVVARIGGEEFAILLTNTDGETASRIAETLREAVAEMVIAWESAMLRVTVSCGVASAGHAGGTSADTLVRRADRALYAAKAAGRNCVRTEAA